MKLGLTEDFNLLMGDHFEKENVDLKEDSVYFLYFEEMIKIRKMDGFLDKKSIEDFLIKNLISLKDSNVPDIP